MAGGLAVKAVEGEGPNERETTSKLKKVNRIRKSAGTSEFQEETSRSLNVVERGKSANAEPIIEDLTRDTRARV